MLLNTDFLAATLLCLYCSILPTLQEPTGKLCPVKNGAPGCICDSFDLSSLASTDNVPKFSGLSDPNGFVYDFNPCNTFTGLCSDVYICQSGFNNGETYDIATTGDEGIYIDTDDIPYIYYTAPEGRQVRVTLVCDESDAEPSVTTLGDSDPGSFLIYKFTLTAKAACPISGGGSAAGIAGIVMMILLLAGIAAYFVIGGVVMKFRYQKNGSDLIINKVFWFALPGLIKEGFVFTFAPCFKLIKGGFNRGDGYKEQL